MLLPVDYAKICKKGYHKYRFKKTKYTLSYHGNERVVMIRGTNNLKDVLQYMEFKYKFDKEIGANIHSGFCKTADEIVQKLQEETNINKHDSLSFTGHSAGGSISRIVASKLYSKGFSIGKVVTFGEPKMTDERGAKTFASFAFRGTRYVNQNDIVTCFPPNHSVHVEPHVSLCTKSKIPNMNDIVKYYVDEHDLDTYINAIQEREKGNIYI